MENTTEIKHAVEHIIGDYGWMFIIGFVSIMFQSTIKSLVASLAVFCGGDYNTDDVVFVDGRPGRIIRVGLLKTVFFIYNVVDNKIVSGNKLVIQNEALSKLRIEKPLPEIDLSKIKN